MRLYFKVDGDEIHIDVANRFVEEVEAILQEYNWFYHDVAGYEPIKDIRKEYNIFNYGKAKEEKETTN